MFSNLQNGTVNIYYIRIDPKEQSGIEAGEFLDKEELAYYSRCSGTLRKNHFLYGRALVKSIISWITGLPKSNVHISKDSYKRLYLDGMNFDRADINSGKLDFNLSHSGGIVACAIMLNGKVGIDVESIKRDIYHTGLSFFHNNEIKYLLAQTEQNKRKAACKIWTLKESYVKCKKQGFAVPFESFNVLENNELIFKSFHIEDYYISIAIESILKNIKKRIKEICLNNLLEIESFKN